MTFEELELMMKLLEKSSKNIYNYPIVMETEEGLYEETSGIVLSHGVVVIKR